MKTGHARVMLIGVCLAVVVVAFLAYRSLGFPELAPAAAPMGDRFPPQDSVRKFRVYVFLDPKDCRNSTGFLTLFQRDTVNYQRPTLWLLGSPDSLAVMTEALVAGGTSIPLNAATAAQQEVPRLLGSRGTPFIVIIDPDQVIRLAMYSPPGSETYVRFPALLRALVGQGLTDPLIDNSR